MSERLHEIEERITVVERQIEVAGEQLEQLEHDWLMERAGLEPVDLGGRLSGRAAIAGAFKIVREGRMPGKPAADVLAELKARFDVVRWQFGGANMPWDCVRIAGVPAGSGLGLDTVLALWANNAIKALRVA